MELNTLLLLTIFLPLFGTGLIWVLAPLGRNYVRWGALTVAIATLVAAAVLIWRFDPANAGATVLEEPWLATPGGTALQIQFSVGLDGVGLWLFGLSALLMVTAVLVSWEAIDEQPALFYSMLLLLEFGCLGVFTARDIILFYVFFEFTLIPLFFLIGIWGSEQRRYAAVKFFLYTLAGSVLTFLGLLAIVIWHGARQMTELNLSRIPLNFSIPELTDSLQSAAEIGQGMPLQVQVLIFLALIAGFAIKVPLFPLHTWLPLAHVQAPTAGSVLLAGVLLKIGGYGFLRFCLPMLPDATVVCTPWILWVSVVGILYGALVALAQTDIKRLIAYSSVSHLGYCMLGIFALNQIGLQGGTLQLINHGISTGGLFAIVGMLYERYHTREIRQLGGIARRTPWLAFFMLVFTFSSIGLPGLNGFAGEFLVLVSMFQRAWQEPLLAWSFHLKLISVLAVGGVVLGAWYMLWLCQRIFFGPLHEPHADSEGGAHEAPHGVVRDLSWREIAALAPLTVFVVWIGLHPGFFLERMDRSLRDVEAAVVRPVQAQTVSESQALHVPVPTKSLTRAR